MTKAAKYSSFNVEFRSVDILLRGKSQTRCVDAFILAWIKHEKQIRRIFTYIVFQSLKDKKGIIDAIASKILYADDFIDCFDLLHAKTYKEIVGDNYSSRIEKLEVLSRKYRNKIMHGQLTGEGLSPQLLTQHVMFLKSWCRDLAIKMDKVIHYDGLERNSLKKSEVDNLVYKRTLQDIDSLEDFLLSQVKRRKDKNRKKYKSAKIG